MSYRWLILATVNQQPGNLEDLVRLVDDGEPVKYLFFWGHRPQRDGSVGPGCLSQWWPAPFEVDGARFATAEHYMMWRKALLFGDTAIAEKILAASHPHRAKSLGRQVHDFDQQTWDTHRFEVVVAASVAKFGQHADLRGFLLATRERVLVEASPTDRVWGIGLAAGDERVTDPRTWRGLNLLGFALMHARTLLAAAAR